MNMKAKWALGFAWFVATMFASSVVADLLNTADSLVVAGGWALALVWFIGSWVYLDKAGVIAWAWKMVLMPKAPPPAPKRKPRDPKGPAAAAIALLMVVNAGCYTVVSPGHAGIKVNMSGSERGVANYTVETGRVFYNPWNTKVFEYPTFVQTATWTANPKEGKSANEEISFNSKEGVRMAADISLSYQLEHDKVPAFYVMFRTDELDVFTHGFLHNVARDAFSELGPTYTVEEIYSSKMGELMQRVHDRINGVVNPFGVKVVQFGFIGAPRPPENILQALNGKVQAIQDAARAQNKLQQTEAEARQAVAKAGGEADANAKLASSLSPSLLEWRRLDIQEKLSAKWDGKLPTVSGGVTPLLQLPHAP